MFYNIIKIIKTIQSFTLQNSDLNKSEENMKITVMKSKTDQILQQMLSQC